MYEPQVRSIAEKRIIARKRNAGYYTFFVVRRSIRVMLNKIVYTAFLLVFFVIYLTGCQNTADKVVSLSNPIVLVKVVAGAEGLVCKN
jgi:hypothetical protein